MGRIELYRKNHGLPCKWDVEKCPFYKNGIQTFKNKDGIIIREEKLNCSPKNGVRCNGDVYGVLYYSNGKIMRVYITAEFETPISEPIVLDLTEEEVFKILESCGHGKLFKK